MYTALQAAASPLGQPTLSNLNLKDFRKVRADDGTRTRDPHLGKVMLYQLSHIRTQSLSDWGLVRRYITTVGDTGFEPVTSSVSGKRATTAPIARADDGTRTRDPHLGKVMLYQLSHIRVIKPPERFRNG